MSNVIYDEPFELSQQIDPPNDLENTKDESFNNQAALEDTKKQYYFDTILFFGLFIGFSVLAVTIVCFTIGEISLALVNLLIGSIIITNVHLRLLHYSIFAITMCTSGLAYDFYNAFAINKNTNEINHYLILHTVDILSFSLKVLSLVNLFLFTLYFPKYKNVSLTYLIRGIGFNYCWRAILSASIHLGNFVIFLILKKPLLATLNVITACLLFKSKIFQLKTDYHNFIANFTHSILLFCIFIALFAYSPYMSYKFPSEGYTNPSIILFLFLMQVLNFLELAFYSKMTFDLSQETSNFDATKTQETEQLKKVVTHDIKDNAHYGTKFQDSSIQSREMLANQYTNTKTQSAQDYNSHQDIQHSVRTSTPLDHTPT